MSRDIGLDLGGPLHSQTRYEAFKPLTSYVSGAITRLSSASVAIRSAKTCSIHYVTDTRGAR